VNEKAAAQQRAGRLDLVSTLVRETMAGRERRALVAHAVRCPACRALLSRDVEIGRRLALLRVDEPTFDVLDHVMRRIGEEDQAEIRTRM
jgi:hypothetical protein